jgi:diphthamide synthase (EF-2-diphthine--ammonia ligase)
MSEKEINRLRRLAKKHGLRFYKSTWRRDSLDNMGGYQLIDAMSNTVIDGDRFDMAISDVERRLAILTTAVAA